jgi:predicted dehydrogenase
MERRRFISMAVAGSAAVASNIYFKPGHAGQKLRIGLIGAGWYGMVDTKAALASGGVEIIGICDVDSEHLSNSADEIAKLQGGRPETFKDYDDLLGMDGLEAVIIGTPPHWHALQFIAACRKGLDIYCEKPLSYDVMEGLAMVNAAEKAGNIVQIGFQRRQSRAFARAKELLASGRIGNVHQIAAQINYIPVLKDTTIQQPPESLDWDAWCGPAPMLDYCPNIGHMAWRLEKEYGNGHLVDWGIHHIDIIRHITGETMPEKLYSEGGIFQLQGKITTPDTLTSAMTFKTAPLLWQHRLWGVGDADREFNNGIFFHGEKGTIFAEDSRLVIFEPGKEGKREELTIPTDSMQEAHVNNFLEAVKTKNRDLISCTPADAFRSTATVQLAMISYYTGSLVRWDPVKMEIPDNPAASGLLSRRYRGKYRHP